MDYVEECFYCATRLHIAVTVGKYARSPHVHWVCLVLCSWPDIDYVGGMMNVTYRTAWPKGQIAHGR